MSYADELKELIHKRTGLEPRDLVCPREKSDMTPCVARDGDLALLSGRCAGCGASVRDLLADEQATSFPAPKSQGARTSDKDQQNQAPK